jgi:ParB-like chromosome segregation protein Spo0J
MVATINRTQWPADTVERRPLKSLLPYARNARTHSPEQIEQIAASIREWGFTVPVLVDDAGTLIAGHGRVLAAQSLGLADVPTMVATGWSAEQIRAYRIADNKLTLNGGWDDDALRFELAELQDAGFDLGLTGFGEHELMGLLGADADIVGMPDLPDGDKTEYQQMTFTLHDDQAKQVDMALGAAKAIGPFSDGLNENSNGNALARICALFMAGHADC